jgi:CubicO group peptidase (beta-lactamase class C family)
MSLADWGRFSIDQMEGAQGRGRLLKPESYLFMQTPQVDVSGLGWGVVPRVLGRQGPALTHSGSDGNWNAIVMLFPETGDGLLVVANAAESMGGDAASVAVARALLPDLAPPAPAPAAAP